MTGTIRCISKMNLSLLMSNVTRQFMFNGCRTIYTESSLGLTDYRRSRDVFMNKYQTGIEAFLTKMQNTVAADKEMVFTEDLKAILHLVEKNPDGIELLQNCILKFNTQSSELRFSSFKFGPVVMRALHYLNEPDVARALFLDPQLDQFFGQFSACLVLLDLLYESGQYAEILVVYDKIRQKYVDGVGHPKLALVLVALACQKLNTPESLEYGLVICKELQQRGVTPVRRFVAILSMLALKQDKPNIALELVSSCNTKDYVSIRCVRVLALLELNKMDDVVIALRDSLRRGIPHRNQYYKDTIEKLEAAIEELGIDEDAEIRTIIKTMKATGYIYDRTLEEHLHSQIQTTPRAIIPNDHRYHDEGWADGRRRDSREGTASGRPNNNRRNNNFSERTNQYN